MMSSARHRWSGLSRSRKLRWVLTTLAAVVCVAAALNYMATSDGIDPIDPANPVYSYLAVVALIALDAVVPIFPGETTLNTAATAASQGNLDLTWVIVAGALGAIVGDSTLFWLARRYPARVEPLRQRAQANARIREALAIMDSSAGALIVGGRYVPGMRFVVNATMGSSQIPYRRFLGWSALSGGCCGACTPPCSPTRSESPWVTTPGLHPHLRCRHLDCTRADPVHPAPPPACCGRSRSGIDGDLSQRLLSPNRMKPWAAPGSMIHWDG